MAPLCREPPVFGPDVLGSQTLRAFGSAFWFGPSSRKVRKLRGLHGLPTAKVTARLLPSKWARPASLYEPESQW